MVTKRSNAKWKITVIKSLAYSLYSSLMLYISDQLINKVEHALLNFIWNGKHSEVQKSTIISDISDGGVKMPHFRT